VLPRLVLNMGSDDPPASASQVAGTTSMFTMPDSRYLYPEYSNKSYHMSVFIQFFSQ
jgi:hypothetical protein